MLWGPLGKKVKMLRCPLSVKRSQQLSFFEVHLVLRGCQYGITKRKSSYEAHLYGVGLTQCGEITGNLVFEGPHDVEHDIAKKFKSNCGAHLCGAVDRWLAGWCGSIWLKNKKKSCVGLTWKKKKKIYSGVPLEGSLCAESMMTWEGRGEIDKSKAKFFSFVDGTVVPRYRSRLMRLTHVGSLCFFFQKKKFLCKRVDYYTWIFKSL